MFDSVKDYLVTTSAHINADVVNYTDVNVEYSLANMNMSAVCAKMDLPW